MLYRKYRITFLTVLAILSLSIITPGLALAAEKGISDKDWEYVNGGQYAQNFSPQTQINKDSINNLEVKWLFPVGSRALAPTAITSITLTEGVNTPPIVKNGIVSIVTNFRKVYGVDAATGKQLWTYDYTVNLTAVKNRLPVSLTAGHLHGISYWEAQNAVLAPGLACDFFGVDLNTGKEKFRVNDLCLNVPGNVYNYGAGAGANLNNIGTYDKGNLFIYAMIGNGGGNNQVGRNFIMGIDMTTQKIVWRVFNQPPQDVPVKDWALQECDIGYFQNIPCSEVRAKNLKGLEYDWQAVPGEPAHWANGVSANWGQAVIDDDTGLVYINTGNQSPYTNASLRPGPNLYGSTIMAIDMNAGKRVWWLQPFPHDPYDFDCNWSGMLIDHPTLGKVYIKGCKEGIYYVIDAKTGKPLQMVDAMSNPDPKIGTQPQYKRYNLTNPLKYEDLTKPWPAYPEDKPIIFNPGTLHGYFSSELAYHDGVIFHPASNDPSYVWTAPVELGKPTSWVNIRVPAAQRPFLQTNTSLVARDLLTGQIKWTYFYAPSAQRAFPAVTGGLIVWPSTDGILRLFDEKTGTVLRQMNLGSGMVVGATVGKDKTGNSMIFAVVGAAAATGWVNQAAGLPGSAPNLPGTLVGIGLSGKASGGVSTVTTTSTTTSITTTTSATTSTVTTTSATTVTSATTSTVTTASATTVTSTLAKTTTITSNAPTQTVTQSVTQTAGLPSEITYAAVGVAVIAIAAAAVLVMRKK